MTPKNAALATAASDGTYVGAFPVQSANFFFVGWGSDELPTPRTPESHSLTFHYRHRFRLIFPNNIEKSEAFLSLKENRE